MKINFLTLFPNYFEPLKKESIIAKAIEKGLVEINIIDIRDFTSSKHKKVDDKVFGGGQGMLLQIEPIFEALKQTNGFTIAMSPQGKVFNQKKAREFSTKSEITIIAGRYEGFDERIIDHLVDEEITIGDYVLTGGELPAMVVADAIIRLIPGVIRLESHLYESFEQDILDYPQYTRPREFNGWAVPEVLFQGNHKKIEEWRKIKQLEKTKRNRPDIIERIQNEKYFN